MYTKNRRINSTQIKSRQKQLEEKLIEFFIPRNVAQIILDYGYEIQNKPLHSIYFEKEKINYELSSA